MYLVERYIMGETRRSVFIIVGFLIFIFASYSTQRYLTDAANGLISLQAVFYIVFYKVLIALEMLLPVGLYVSVAIALGQLHSDSEVIAILASGSSALRLYKAILYLAVPVGILVTVLSMYARPWAYAQIYQLKQDSQSQLDTRHLLAKKFNLNDSGRMILAEKIDPETQVLTDALIYTSSAGKTYVFRARTVQIADPAPVTPSVIFHAGTAYELDHKGSADNGQIYNTFNLHPKPVRQETEVRSKAASVSELSRSADPAYRAELQWRESRGVSAILMALLAVSLSRTKPRQGRFSTLLPLAVVFTLIFYAGNISRTLTANHILATFPGVWSVPLLMMLGLLILLARELSLWQKFFR